MPSENALNAKNLTALGAERLAELLLDMASGDAAAKRRLRLELASRCGGGNVAAEIRKRLVSIGKSRSFVDWRKIRTLAQELELQRWAIMTHVAPTKSGEAFDLLWRLIELAPSVYERCDDSNGTIGSVIALARDDLGTISAQTSFEPVMLADRVFTGVRANDYGQFDNLITLMAHALGEKGLGLLKGKFEDMAANPPQKAAAEDRKAIGWGSGGPIYQDDFDIRNHVRTVQSALTEITDALGDVDGYAALFSDEDRANPAIAADIAERLLKSGRAAEAMAALDKAKANFGLRGHWPAWQKMHIDALDALGRSAEAQDERWAIFARDLDAEYLRDHLKRLPDFDDEEAEQRALDHVAGHMDFPRAFAFLINWPAHDRAAVLVLARHAELNGDHYWLLTPAAEALEQSHPLAATLMLRAMIDFTLDKAKSTRYGHASRHLQRCAHMARKIEDFGGHAEHEAYVAGLRLRHARKSGFWNG